MGKTKQEMRARNLL